MYVQIMDHIKQRAVTGDWPPGYAIPSIRELAVTLKVSVITVKRAYQELEHEGVIATRRGMGSVIAEQTVVAGQKQAELTDHLLEAIKIAQLLNLSKAELKQRLADLIQQQM